MLDRRVGDLVLLQLRDELRNIFRRQFVQGRQWPEEDYNFETTLMNLFGQDQGISESLTYSLQFSTMRDPAQQQATKRALSSDMADIKRFVENYRSQLPQDVFDSEQYSVKLIQIPKIANASRNDLAIEFVNWNSLSEEDKKNYRKLDAIIKDKIVKQPVINLGGMRPSKVLEKIESKKRR